MSAREAIWWSYFLCASSLTLTFSGYSLSFAECGSSQAGHFNGVILQHLGMSCLYPRQAVSRHLWSSLRCFWEQTGHRSVVSLYPTLGCPYFQHLVHCVVSVACHIILASLCLPMNIYLGSNLGASTSGIFTIIEVGPCSSVLPSET